MKELLEWFWGTLQGAHATPAALGILIGVALSEFLAHILPPTMNAYAADRITRLVCFGVSMTSTFALDTTLLGFFFALLAGLAGPTVHGFTLRYVNSRWPNMTPCALITGPNDDPPPRALLPRTELSNREP